ncbi:hypothetical protein MNEG_2856 [Monoraphidium neglectum]|uniref:Uncharacterized protein n=1 Tax=Monoraphidium neglectum TaxID=145388 RepID=A0A0D2MXG7_9CHLO|nr:hypothetical protein MNEG_2856 [Monoraphidium neglectum]KIZ05092.1 hypothetical protein MNEG_2856 [Monoraphidium neglectum]|eukprot:XP_013904111.1 hypothetical protein MNEG_2856 [Monoraphidium neglectum]
MHLGDVHIHSLFAAPGGPSAVMEGGVADLAHVPGLGQRIKGATTLPLLLDLLRSESGAFRPRDTSQALHRLACLHRQYVRRLRAARLATREAQQAARDDYVSPALALLGDLILRQGEELDPWAVSLACWSYGVLDHHDDDVLGVLCRRGATCLRAFQPIDCASALVGWARLRVRTRPQREFVDQLLSQSLDSL